MWKRLRITLALLLALSFATPARAEAQYPAGFYWIMGGIAYMWAAGAAMVYEAYLNYTYCPDCGFRGHGAGGKF